MIPFWHGNAELALIGPVELAVERSVEARQTPSLLQAWRHGQEPALARQQMLTLIGGKYGIMPIIVTRKYGTMSIQIEQTEDLKTNIFFLN